MTFKDLQKLVQSQSNPEQYVMFPRLKNKPFWIWDQKQHKQEDIRTGGDCCFNHGIGLPKNLDLRVILNRFLVDKQAHKKIPSLESRATKLWDKIDRMYKYKQKGKEDR
jgi:hypothetical protein